jgi:hypothetical protein
MRKKIFLILFLNGILVSIDAQQTDFSGDYRFEKAIVSTTNAETGSEVYTKTFTDSIGIDDLLSLPFPWQPVMKKAFISSDGRLSIFTVFGDDRDFIVNELNQIVPVKENREKDADGLDNENMFSTPYSLNPLMKTEFEGRRVTLTFHHLFGNSNYNFTIKGLLKIIMIKE